MVLFRPVHARSGLDPTAGPASEPEFAGFGVAHRHVARLLGRCGRLRPETGPESQVGRGSEALDASQRQMADLVTRTAGWNVPRLDGRGTKYWIERGLAGGAIWPLSSP